MKIRMALSFCEEIKVGVAFFRVCRYNEYDQRNV